MIAVGLRSPVSVGVMPSSAPRASVGCVRDDDRRRLASRYAQSAVLVRRVEKARAANAITDDDLARTNGRPNKRGAFDQDWLSRSQVISRQNELAAFRPASPCL
jgi:hypothetical protein